MNKLIIGLLLMGCVGVASADKLTLPGAGLGGVQEAEVEMICVNELMFIVIRSNSGSVDIEQVFATRSTHKNKPVQQVRCK